MGRRFLCYVFPSKIIRCIHSERTRGETKLVVILVSELTFLLYFDSKLTSAIPSRLVSLVY